MSAIRFIEAHSPAERAQAFDVRRKVFVVEQKIAERLEFDAGDDGATHLLALLGEEPVGTLRLRVIEGGRTARIERVAVLASARGTRIGQSLVQAALDAASRRGAGRAVLHAQVRARDFYARLGFAATGAEFIEDGIMHIAMQRPLESSPASSSSPGDQR